MGAALDPAAVLYALHAVCWRVRGVQEAPLRHRQIKTVPPYLSVQYYCCVCAIYYETAVKVVYLLYYVGYISQPGGTRILYFSAVLRSRLL